MSDTRADSLRRIEEARAVLDDISRALLFDRPKKAERQEYGRRINLERASLETVRQRIERGEA